MRFGVNLLLFNDTPDAGVLRQFPRLRDLGFDGVEVPIFAPGSIDTERVRRAAERCGLALTASGAPPPGSRFYGRAAAPRKAAERYLLGAIAACRELGATVLCGPLYKPVGDDDDSLPLARQRAETAKALAPCVAAAEAAGVTLAFEPLNRFETNFLNTVDDGVAFTRALGSRSAGLLLDTFHMHIEEKDTAAALKRAAKAKAIAHFHACENDRGAAGSGQVHWPAIAQALRAGGYDGWVVLESFSQTNVAIRRAVSCWRPFYASPLAFCKEGLGFVRGALAPARGRGAA